MNFSFCDNWFSNWVLRLFCHYFRTFYLPKRSWFCISASFSWRMTYFQSEIWLKLSLFCWAHSMFQCVALLSFKATPLFSCSSFWILTFSSLIFLVWAIVEMNQVDWENQPASSEWVRQNFVVGDLLGSGYFWHLTLQIKKLYLDLLNCKGIANWCEFQVHFVSYTFFSNILEMLFRKKRRRKLMRLFIQSINNTEDFFETSNYAYIFKEWTVNWLKVAILQERSEMCTRLNVGRSATNSMHSRSCPEDRCPNSSLWNSRLTL